jgi:predicted RNA-binding Zn-ribbon protein involved in translation (DUF1610 family)
MTDKSMLVCPDCGQRLYYSHVCRMQPDMAGRECERVKRCHNCNRQFVTREVIVRKLPS